VLREIITKIQAGTLGGESFTINLANGGLVIEYNPDYALPTEVKALGEKTVQQIATGAITITLP
jgi:basic membrane lipoprotein Med (substrate-binding protein (PBP1-ABC) superfamily)